MVDEALNNQNVVEITSELLEDGDLKTAMQRVRAGEDIDKVVEEVFQRNIIYVAETEPSIMLRNGNKRYDLPDAATQKKGFYHPEASELIRRYPSKFKRFKRKGDK